MFGHVIVAQFIQFIGGDAHFDERGNVIQRFGGQFASGAHAFKIGWGVKGDAFVVTCNLVFHGRILAVVCAKNNLKTVCLL